MMIRPRRKAKPRHPATSICELQNRLIDMLTEKGITDTEIASRIERDRITVARWRDGQEMKLLDAQLMAKDLGVRIVIEEQPQ